MFLWRRRKNRNKNKQQQALSEGTNSPNNNNYNIGHSGSSSSPIHYNNTSTSTSNSSYSSSPTVPIAVADKRSFGPNSKEAYAAFLKSSPSPSPIVSSPLAVFNIDGTETAAPPPPETPTGNSSQGMSGIVNVLDGVGHASNVPYDSTFEGTLDSDYWRSQFKQYLQSVLNSEPLDFLEQVEKYTVKKSARNRHVAAKKIVDEFLTEKGKREINVSMQHRTNVMTQLQQCCSDEYCPRNLFDEVAAAVTLELKEDCFPKFITSPFFLKNLEFYFNQIRPSEPTTDSSSTDSPRIHGSSPRFHGRHGEDVTQQQSKEASSPNSANGHVKEVEVTQEFFSGMDRTTQRITLSEFEYVLREALDSEKTEWVQVKQKSKVEGRAFYLSKHQFMFQDHSSGAKPKKRYINKLKEEGYLPFGLEESFYVIVDKECGNIVEREWMNGDHLSLTPPSSTHPFATTLYSSRFKCPFPIHNRELVFSASAIRIGDRIIVARKGLNTPDIPKVSKGFVRAETVGGTVLERVYKDKTKFTTVALIDWGGYMPVKLWNYGMTMRDDHFCRGVIKAAEYRRAKHGYDGDSDEVPPPKESFGMVEAFFINSKLVHEQNIDISL